MISRRQWNFWRSIGCEVSIVKKVISVCMLIVRCNIYPVLAVLGGMVLAETVAFFFLGLGEENLYRALSEVPFQAIFSVTLILLSAILIRTLCDRGGKLNNTMQRLQISETAVFWLQAGYNILVFSLLFMVQALVFIGVCVWYAQVHPALANHQSVFIAAYDHPLFHCVFPLDNVLCWVCLVLLIVGLGICSAAYPFRQRRGRRSITTFLMMLLVFFYLYIQREDHHLSVNAAVYAIPAAVLFAGVSLADVLGIEEEAYE